MITIEETVNKNLALMNSSARGGMFALRESLGGNAGSYKGISCYGANFCYHPKTGEILYFGNCQDVPRKIRKHFPSGSFRVALGKTNHEIIQLFINNRFELAKGVLRMTVAEFNSKQKNR